jgi:hypothetical protein
VGELAAAADDAEAGAPRMVAVEDVASALEVERFLSADGALAAVVRTAAAAKACAAAGIVAVLVRRAGGEALPDDAMAVDLRNGAWRDALRKAGRA